MPRILKHLAIATFVFFTSSAIAAPKQLITHNLTNVESNAFIAGVVPSQHPTKANTTASVFWAMVKIACFGHTVNGRCPAVIKMETNSANPVVLGSISLDLLTGDISPKFLSNNGYSLTVNGPAETTLAKDQ